jgi:protein-S-isoprenylcysteine O-methyltransferase Ste14
MAFEANTILEFHLDRGMPKAAAFALALSGVPLLFFPVAFTDEGAPAFLGVAGFGLIVLSIACLTFQKILRLDKQAGTAEQLLRTLFWKHIDHYAIAEFHRVGIGMGGNDISYKTSTRYFVQLIGSKKNVSVPGTSSNKAQIFELGKQIADYLGLPFDDRPKMAFFNRRL